MKKIILSLLSCFAIMTTAVAQNTVTLKAGTIIPLQSVSQVKAADVNEGEYINFQVITNIKVDDCIAIPQGTIVKGVVQEAKKSSIAGTKGRLIININKLILPSGDYVFFTDTSVRIYGKNRTPLAVVTALFAWPCIFITGTKAVMPEGYEVFATIATNTEIKIEN